MAHSSPAPRVESIRMKPTSASLRGVKRSPGRRVVSWSMSGFKDIRSSLGISINKNTTGPGPPPPPPRTLNSFLIRSARSSSEAEGESVTTTASGNFEERRKTEIEVCIRVLREGGILRWKDFAKLSKEEAREAEGDEAESAKSCANARNDCSASLENPSRGCAESSIAAICVERGGALGEEVEKKKKTYAVVGTSSSGSSSSRAMTSFPNLFVGSSTVVVLFTSRLSASSSSSSSLSDEPISSSFDEEDGDDFFNSRSRCGRAVNLLLVMFEASFDCLPVVVVVVFDLDKRFPRSASFFLA